MRLILNLATFVGATCALWAHPVAAWVTFNRGRNGFTQARNGSRPNCGEIRPPIASGLRRKCPRSVRPRRLDLGGNWLGLRHLCATRLADSCLGHGDPSAELRQVFGVGGGVEPARLARHASARGGCDLSAQGPVSVGGLGLAPRSPPTCRLARRPPGRSPLQAGVVGQLEPPEPARSEMSPSARACIRQITRLTSLSLCRVFVVSPNTSAYRDRRSATDIRRSSASSFATFKVMFGLLVRVSKPLTNTHTEPRFRGNLKAIGRRFGQVFPAIFGGQGGELA